MSQTIGSLIDEITKVRMLNLIIDPVMVEQNGKDVPQFVVAARWKEVDAVFTYCGDNQKRGFESIIKQHDSLLQEMKKPSPLSSNIIKPN